MAERREQPSIILSIPAEERQRDLIDQAAELLGRSREGFVLDVACREAEDILLDQVFFPLDDEAFAQFQSMLEHPLSPNDSLRGLLLTKAPWE